MDVSATKHSGQAKKPDTQKPHPGGELNHYINGAYSASSGAKKIQLTNPATGEKTISIPTGTELDAQRAVAAAKAAFFEGPWSAMSNSSRCAILHQFSSLVDQHATELDRLDALDMGKPVSIEFANARASAGLIRYCADALENIISASYSSDNSCFIAQQRVPRGVIAAVVPWNFPVMSAISKIAPALAVGNTVVLKPSECSPRSAARLAELATEAGLPPGVLNVVQGSGAIVAKELALHQDVNMIAFTGSTAVGKLILQYAGQSNMKVAHVECGGKSPQIVFADCHNLIEVTDNIVETILLNQGQLCVAGLRILVEQKIELPLMVSIAERLKKFAVGDPLDPDVCFGPLANRQQMEKVLSYIENGKETAILMYGGERLLPKTGGYFVQPTVFADVSENDPLFQQEIFGPVLTLTRFHTVEEAISLANATPYGLAAYVWTTNLNTGLRLSKEIHAGMVTVNGSSPQGEGSQAISTEPYGQSGVGAEFGMAGLESYTRAQVAWLNHK
jgi:acyl-CoA reductase-like NAD-dependent aldehyde dehydrogenase